MSRPNIPEGLLGGQSRLGEVKLKPDSHKDAEFRVIAENTIVMKFKTGQPVKLTTKLTHFPSDKELSEYVFIQRKDFDSVEIQVGFPENGWYQLMIFGLPESDPNASLPNLYNYLINVERIIHPAQPFVKAYTKFYTDCCYLYEPLVLNSSSPYLDHTRFKLVVPGAHKVAVHSKDEWHQLEKKGDKWEGSVNLLKYKGTDAKITVNGSYTKDGGSYSVLLEYHV